jgi:alpha/beta superfamily hydrolase
LADIVREIPGAIGSLECLIDRPQDGAARRRRVRASRCPSKGGTMHTKVVYQSAKALAEIGCVVLRFNFRGVGRSAGAWDEGRGEMDDYRAAVAYMAKRHPGLELWAAGFSFGSYIAMTAGADDERICAMIGIAPPVDRYEFGSVKLSTKPKFVIHGELDELISAQAGAAVLRPAERPEGARRNRSRQPSVRGAGERGRRRAARPADGLLMHDAVIVSAVRTAVGKAPNGALRTVRPDEMAATVIGESLRRAPASRPGDRRRHPRLRHARGRAGAERRAHRQPAGRRAGAASAVTINRFCSSGLQAIAFAAERIMCGWAQAIVAGGTESMSLVPMGGNKVSPNPALVESYPDVYLTTGLVAENHVRDYSIGREEQDAFALRSHERALAAIDAGRFIDEIVPLINRVARRATVGCARPVREVTFAQDEGPRRDTSLAALAKLKAGVSQRPAASPPGTRRRRATAPRPSWSRRRRSRKSTGCSRWRAS